jgi:hypothetical protein
VTSAELLARLNEVELRMLAEPELIEDLRPKREVLQAELLGAELAERREPEERPAPWQLWQEWQEVPPCSAAQINCRPRVKPG